MEFNSRQNEFSRSMELQVMFDEIELMGIAKSIPELVVEKVSDQLADYIVKNLFSEIVSKIDISEISIKVTELISESVKSKLSKELPETVKEFRQLCEVSERARNLVK